MDTKKKRKPKSKAKQHQHLLFINANGKIFTFYAAHREFSLLYVVRLPAEITLDSSSSFLCAFGFV